MTRRPRVLLVGPFPPTKGGITTFMLNLISSPLASEFDFVPYTTSRPPKKDVIDNYGYSAILRGGIRRLLVGVALTAFRWMRLPATLIGRNIDLVQVHASDYQVFWEGVAYVCMAQLFGRPAVLRLGGHFDHFYESSSSLGRWCIRRALKAPRILIIQSNFVRDFVHRAGREKGVLVLPNWFRDPVEERRRSSYDRPPVCLFVAGTEAVRKGIEDVVGAMSRLDKSGNRTKFHILALTPPLIEQVLGLKLSNVSVLEGPVEHGRVLECMRLCDIFLLPSRGEGFPNSLVEAMATGMPSIVTPVASVPEMVSDGGAITIPMKDTAALVLAIETLAQDADLRWQMGQDAQRTIRSRYTADIVLPSLAAAYRGLLPVR